MKQKRFSLYNSKIFTIIAFLCANFLFISHTHAVGSLKVDTITSINTSAIADNTFTNGWKWTFDITVPDGEIVFKMKFDDFKKGSEGIAAGGNIRISSEQSSNAKSATPVTLSSANSYSEKIDLIPSADLDATKDGIQIKVIIEARVPVGSANGAYGSSYGVFSDINNRPSVRLISPNGDETFVSDSPNNSITWEAVNTGKFTINIISEDGVTQRHIQELDSEKRSTIFIMPIIPAGKYKMYITDNLGTNDYTDGYFNITTTAEQAISISKKPEIMILNPNGNETLKIGEVSIIRWASSQDVDKITVNMESESGDVKLNILSDIDARLKSSIFTVPNVHMGKYKMYITNGPITDYTDNLFNIVIP